MSMRIHDRRRHERLPYERPVKVYDPRSRRYRSGVTRNISASGALIELHAAMAGAVGDQVQVAIDWTGVSGVIPQSDMTPVSVARLTSEDGKPLLAVQFAAAQPVPMAA